MKNKATIIEITKEGLFEMLTKKLEIETADLKEHNKLKAILLPLHGKPLVNRTFKKLPEIYTINNRAGMCHIETEINGKKRSHLIGYFNSGDGCLNADKFDDFDSCYYAGSIGRINQIKNLLGPQSFNKLFEIFNRLQKAMGELRNVSIELEGGHFESYDNPCYYQLLSMCGAGSQLLQDLKYGNEIR